MRVTERNTQDMTPKNVKLQMNSKFSYCVRRVKAALVMEVGRFRPLVISLQIFLFITSTRPPFSVTSLKSL